MRRKKVWRYWCDHCNKGGCSASGMAKHEKHCTMNPKRLCRVCAQDPELVQRPMELLIRAYDSSLDELRRVAQGCPACMLAGIRQWKKANVTHMDERGWDYWNYQEENRSYWSERNGASWSE